MANKKNLSLDQQRLVRLQEQQLEATVGGAAAAGSNTIEVTSLQAVADSCCSKSCRDKTDSEAPQA